MSELWRDLSEVLWKRPVLWLPVLVADLLGYLLNVGRGALIRAVVLSRLQHSVLSGQAVGAMTPGVAQSTSILALLLTWTANFLRIFLYAAALVVTARLVWAVVSREKDVSVAAAVRANLGGIFELALRALAIDAVAALLFSLTVSYLRKAGAVAILRNGWFTQGAALLLMVVLAVAVAPVAVRVLAGKAPGTAVSRQAQLLALTLGFVSLLMGTFVATNGAALLHASAGARFGLELVGSLLVALPYAPMFVGLSLLAKRLGTVEGEVLDG